MSISQVIFIVEKTRKFIAAYDTLSSHFFPLSALGFFVSFGRSSPMRLAVTFYDCKYVRQIQGFPSFQFLT